tara:strand:- start:500 stop:733 length:234 start_codon:yes stop_codon:yes gene_type:complete
MTPSKIIDALGGTFKVAKITSSAASTVSDWRMLSTIPFGKLVLLSYPLELATNGKHGRKQLFPKIWPQIWPELEKKQ